MPTLPDATAFTGSGVTEGQFKTAMTDLRGFLAGVVGTGGTPATALAAIGAMFSGYSAKSSAYTVISSDRGVLLNCDGTWELALTSAVSLGAGFAFGVRNNGSGVITINPSGSQTVDGATTLALAAGQSCAVISTGANWVTLGRQATPPSAGRLLRITRYTTAGSGTWTKGSDVGAILVRACGGGGGAGRGGSTMDGETNGLGGGGGGYADRYISSPDASYAYTVGAGGAAATTEATSGSAGGATTIAGMTCNGGAGGGIGLVAIGGAGGTATGGQNNSAGSSGIMTLGGASPIGGGGHTNTLGGIGGGGGGNAGNATGKAGRQGYIEIWEFSA